MPFSTSLPPLDLYEAIFPAEVCVLCVCFDLTYPAIPHSKVNCTQNKVHQRNYSLITMTALMICLVGFCCEIIMDEVK